MLAPVAVVGAGPTGLTVAVLLALRGVPVVVLEKQPVPYALPRAVHLDDEVLRVLQAAGVAEQFTAVSRPALGLRLLDAQHRVMAEFGRARAVGEHGWPQASMFDQPDLERLLRDRLAGLGVEVRTGQVVGLDGAESREPSVRLADGSVVSASAVLGCDGAASTVRDLIGSTQRDLGFEERWLVVDGRTPQDLRQWEGVHQVCDPTRAATYLRVGEDRYRWEFRLHSHERAGDLDLRALLAPWVSLDAVEVQRVVPYTFRARVTDRWRRGQVLLLGDAAHETPPFVGQGLGSGLRDAVNLAWKLTAVLAGADEGLLDTYQSEREPHVRTTIRTAVLCGWAMTGGQDRAAAVRRVAVSALCAVPGGSGLLDRGSPPLRPGPLVRRDRLSGRLVPQVRVGGGGAGVLLDELLGDGWAVVSAQGPVREVAGARSLVVPELADWLGTRTVLVRPDRVVAGELPRRDGV